MFNCNSFRLNKEFWSCEVYVCLLSTAATGGRAEIMESA